MCTPRALEVGVYALFLRVLISCGALHIRFFGVSQSLTWTLNGKHRLRTGVIREDPGKRRLRGVQLNSYKRGIFVEQSEAGKKQGEA